MADKKISALTSASTPLTGAEVLPIVQSGATVKATVADIAGAGAYAGSFTTLASTGLVTLTTSSGTTTISTAAPTMPLPSGIGWGSGFNRKAMQLVTSDNSGGNTGIFVRRADFSIGVDLWSDNYFGDAYLDSRFDNAVGRILLRTRTAGTPVDVLIASPAGVTIPNGNLVQGTAAKGVNFTANTPAAGMTSQLLNWYEEGTFTPTVDGITLSIAAGRYTRFGRTVFVELFCRFPATADTTTTVIASLPFTPNTNGNTWFGNVGVQSSLSTHVRNYVLSAGIRPQKSDNTTFTNADFSSADVNIAGTYTA